MLASGPAAVVLSVAVLYQSGPRVAADTRASFPFHAVMMGALLMAGPVVSRPRVRVALLAAAEAGLNEPSAAGLFPIALLYLGPMLTVLIVPLLGLFPGEKNGVSIAWALLAVAVTLAVLRGSRLSVHSHPQIALHPVSCGYILTCAWPRAS